ncbi:hypothetical protein B0H14DRAFT_2573574 [Mycena olivaceomarginata]|nr:hypothetical protein B0H14DRAFT_2573574 [Mycena olivaceomarginata]
MSFIMLACNSPASANIRVATYYLCIVDATSPPPTSWDVDSLTAVIREQARGTPSRSKDTDTSHGPNTYVAARDLDASSGPPAVLQVNRSELFIAAFLLAGTKITANLRLLTSIAGPSRPPSQAAIDEIRPAALD